jgi:nitronate monooxygenase
MERTEHHTAFTAMAGCDLPIQLAPMPGAVTPDLALAVVEAGGHVSYPCVGKPAHVVALELERLATHRRAISASFIAPMLNREALDVALARVAMVDFHGGEPTAALVERAHAAGRLVGWQIGSLAAAQRAEQAGCDLVIAQGCEAGGRAAGSTALLPLLAEIEGALTIPVLAAGGIATAGSVRAALAAGADGVRVGTRFIAARESAAHAAWIEAILAARGEDAVVTDLFSSGVPVLPHRVLRTSIAAARAHEAEVIGEMELGGLVRQLERFQSFPPDRSFHGSVDAMPFYAGQGVGAVRDVLPAAEIVADLARGLPRAAVSTTTWRNTP